MTSFIGLQLNRTGESMLLGVVSDTHGRVAHTVRAVRMLEALKVAQVLHCGDIGSSEIVTMFSAWPTHFVFGNVDYDRETLAEQIAAAGQTCYGEFGAARLMEREIAFLHGDDSRGLDATIRDGRWQLVCHGHTHIARRERFGDTLVLNPGAVFRANPHSIAVVDLADMKATIVALD